MNYVDIQVNGYAGIDFLGPPLTEKQLRTAAERLWADGLAVVLPTVVTDEIELMAKRLAAMRKIIDGDRALRRLFPAFHIEGPCLSPTEGYRGAHFPQFMKPASRDVLEPLIEASGGPERVAIVTLAPEVDAGLKTTAWLAGQGIAVSLGHTDAPLGVLRDAEAAGATIFTHLGNGCANIIPRHDNILNRALSLEKITYSLIPDGHHIPWFVLKNWIRWAGVERCVFTTDCVSPAAAPPGLYKVGYWDVEVGPDLLARAPGKSYLAGSALTMPVAHANAIKHLGLSEAQTRALMVDQPRRLIESRLVG